jgi:hydrogenase maturation protease
LRYLVGLGTYMAFDDSVGIRVVERVVSGGLEQGFRAVDLSGNLLNLVAYLTPETEAMVLVDAARMGLAPGEYRFFNPADVTTRKAMAGVSTHEGDLLKVLGLVRSLGYSEPPLVIMGIEPEIVREEMRVSATLEARLDEYARAAIRRLAEL